MRLPLPSRGIGLAAACCWIVLTIASHAMASTDEHRLSRDVVPTHQDIVLRLDPDRPDYSGSVRIALDVRAPMPSFRLHAEGLVAEKVELVAGSHPLPVTFDVQEEGDFLVITADRELAPGGYELAIDFTNTYDTTAQSLYRMLREGDGYLFTQFESDDARGAFPCFDEPSFKCTFQITLEVPAHQTAVTNTPVRSEAEEGTIRRVVFEPTPVMSSYLLAIAAGPMERVPIEGMSVPGAVYCPRGQSHLAAEAVRTTPPILAALEEYFGRPYPFAKIDLIAVPEFWPGAMENVGAVTYRDSILLLDSNAATVSQLRWLCEVTAHELAHQWFGNLVTMQWWDDLWLNESFASWLGNKITDQVYPEYGVALSEVEGTLGAMVSDARLSTRAIRQPVAALDNLMQSADVLAYEKGSAVLGMFEEFVGAELFRDGVLRYIENNAWSNATADDLWTGLSEATGLDIGSAMATFLDQPGVPKVTTTVLGDGRVELRQERFLNYGVSVDEEQTWQIPVVLRYHDGQQVRTERVLLTQPTQILEIPGGRNPQWIHPAAGENAYYQWSIASDMLRTLTENSSELLEVRERVALVGRLSALLDAGEISGADYLASMSRLAEDPRPEVVDAMLSALSKVRYAFVTADRAEAFAHYVRQTLRPVADRIGLEPREGEPEAVSMLRPSLLTWLGWHGQDEDVRAFATEAAQAFLADETAIDPSIVNPCLRLAALDAGWSLYNEYKKRYEAADVPRERTRYLAALGYFQDEGIAEAALWYSIHGPTRPTEFFSVPSNVAQLHIETDLVWDWMTQNYDTIRGKLPEMFAIYMPYFAGGCTEERLSAMEAFFSQEGHFVQGQDKEMAKVAEGIRDCTGLREREGASVAEYLASTTPRERGSGTPR